jgi:hypothetical protein
MAGRCTGMIPLVRDVGYVYALLPSVFSRIFCSSKGMSRPSAVAEAGRGAARTTEAPARSNGRIKVFMAEKSHRDRFARTSKRPGAGLRRKYTS